MASGSWAEGGSRTPPEPIRTLRITAATRPPRTELSRTGPMFHRSALLADPMEHRAGRIQGVVATRWFLLFDEFIEFFAWGVVAEAFSGAVVEFVFDGLELGGGVLAEVGALGEVLAEQAVGVLVAAALPG